MSLFERAKEISKSAPPSPQPGPTPPKFNPPSWNTPVSRPSLPQRQGLIQKPITAKPSPPRSLFEEKKDWTRADFLRRAGKSPWKRRSFHERKKMLNEAFPSRRFSTYISESETKRRLRELRREGYRAKTGAEKSKLTGLRKYLEKQTGLKGKY